MRGKSVKGSTTPTKTQQVVYRCTACQEVIATHHDAVLHPLLDTLICLQCHAKYGTGDFAHQWDDGVDDLGDDNYCRWCCDGGNLIGCSTCVEGDDNQRCHYMFCEDCIRFNQPNDPYLVKKDSEENPDQPAIWYCFVCDRSRLKKLRSKAQAAIKDLMTREPTSLIADITPKNPIGRPLKTRDTAGRDSGAPAVTSTPTTTTYCRPCPASKKPQAQQAAQQAPQAPSRSPARDAASSAQDDMDIDVMSVSPGKPPAKSPTTDEGASVKQQKELGRKDEPTKVIKDSTKVIKDSIPINSESKSKDKDREASRKSSITSPKDPDQSYTTGSKESGKKVKENGLSKRDKEARVEGEPIVAPADADLIALGDQSKHKARDIRRASDSFNPTNPMKKRRTDSLSTESLSKVSSSTLSLKKVTDKDKASASATRDTGLEPQMIYNKTVAAPTTTVDKQQAHSNGTSETKQKHQSAANGRDLPVTSSTSALTTSKVGPISVLTTQESPKQKINSARPINGSDLKKRLDLYSKTSKICIEEMGAKFDKLIDMVNKYCASSDRDTKQSINVEIGSLLRPLEEVEAMIRDLQSLCL